MCYHAKIDKHNGINLDSTPLCPETQRALEELCEECKDIFSLNQNNISHTKLLTVDNNTADNPPMTQKLYTLPLKHIQ